MVQRRHHTIPRFYLSRFANDEGRLLRVPLDEPERANLVSISDASVVNNFYLIQEEDGTTSDRIEKQISRIESEGARGFIDIFDRNEWPISITTRYRVSAWIALQHLRGPAQRKMLNELYDMTAKMEIVVQGREGMRRALEHHSSVAATEEEVDEEFEAFSRTGEYQFVVHPNEHVRLILQELKGITQTMLAREWRIIRFERRALLLSDHPVALIPSTSHPAGMGVGVLNAQGVVVPVSRRTGLYLDWPSQKGGKSKIGARDLRIAGTTDYASWLNKCSLSTAREAVFVHPDDAHLVASGLPAPRRQELGIPDYESLRRMGESLSEGFGV